MKELKRETTTSVQTLQDRGPPKKQKEIMPKMVVVAKEASNAHKAFSETLDEIVITASVADGLVVEERN